MFQNTRNARTLTVGGLLAVAAIGGLASPAQAATKTVNYSCELPFIGTTPVTSTITAQLPNKAKVGVPTGRTTVTTKTTLGGNSAALFQILGASTLEGTATPEANLTAPGLSLPIFTETSIPTTPVSTTGSTVLRGSGISPSLTFIKKGTATIALTGYSLNLTARDANGDPIVIDAQSSFAVPCTQDAGQNATLGSFPIVK